MSTTWVPLEFLNTTAAANAISKTLAACGAEASLQRRPRKVACRWHRLSSTDDGAATIDDFASKGLDSGFALFGGAPVQVYTGGAVTDPNMGAAFAGQNPLMGVGDFEEPIGRSVYNALQTEFKQSMRNPFPYADQ